MTHSGSSRPGHHPLFEATIPLFDARLRPAGDDHDDDDEGDSEMLDLTLLWHRRSHLHRQRSLAAVSKVSSCGHYIRPGANQKPKERCDGQIQSERCHLQDQYHWEDQVLEELVPQPQAQFVALSRPEGLAKM
ncbi:GD20808 [Drosophila simulans]|uniref:GD20808 n=1 Tax=Drosophila simulans TaxID=7240 RepID=B4QX80_DROSI|nr:GD20808 [Drosophila simulans]